MHQSRRAAAAGLRLESMRRRLADAAQSGRHHRRAGSTANSPPVTSASGILMRSLRASFSTTKASPGVTSDTTVPFLQVAPAAADRTCASLKIKPSSTSQGQPGPSGGLCRRGSSSYCFQNKSNTNHMYIEFPIRRSPPDAAGAAGAVGVGGRVAGQLQVEDHIAVLDVQPTRRDVAHDL